MILAQERCGVSDESRAYQGEPWKLIKTFIWQLQVTHQWWQSTSEQVKSFDQLRTFSKKHQVKLFNFTIHNKLFEDKKNVTIERNNHNRECILMCGVYNLGRS